MNRDNQNSSQSNTGFAIGKHIQIDIFQHERAEYGRGILATLSQELSAEYGPGYSYSTPTRMVMFAEVFSEGAIVATLPQQWKWNLNYGKFWR